MRMLCGKTYCVMSAVFVVLISSYICMSTLIRSEFLSQEEGFSRQVVYDMSHDVFRWFTVPVLLGEGRIALKNPGCTEIVFT